jgi:hypothetical protein
MSKSVLVLLLILGIGLIIGAWYMGTRHTVPAPPAPETTSTANPNVTGAPTFVTQQETRASAANYCVYTISYPQAQIAGNASLEQWLNGYLKAQFVPAEKELADCESSVKDVATTPLTQTTTVSYSIKLTTPDLVSLTYTASSYFEGAAHPDNVIEAFTLDLQNRSVVSFNDLLAAHTQKNFNDLLYAAVAQAFADTKQQPYFDKATFLSQYTKDSYDFYLTTDSLVVINLFDVHALQGLEASIPLYELKPYMNPHGVLMRLVSQEAGTGQPPPPLVHA